MPPDKQPPKNPNLSAKPTQSKVQAAAIQRQQAEAVRRNARRRQMVLIGAVAIVAILVLGITLLALPKTEDKASVAAVEGCDNPIVATITDPNQPPGQAVRVSDAGLHLQHIDDTLPATYSSDPPASGWHYAAWASPGPASSTVPDTMLVHNLEHGYVVIDYNYTPGQCVALESKLANIAKAYPKVIANPRPDPAAPKIALTAWGRLEKLNGYDETEIRRFITYWMSKPGNAPEWRLPP